MRKRYSRLTALTATTAAWAVIALSPGTVATADTPSPAPAAGSAAPTFAQPGTAFGPGYGTSADQIVAGIGDEDGYHIMVARESNGFTWSNLVTLDVPSIDEGLWTGYLCTTGDGEYAVAVYAPSAVTNTPALEEAGAFASVVDLATGKATPVAAGVQLAYHSPGCGVGDQAVLTRALGTDDQGTQLLDVDTAAAGVTGIRTVMSQVTNVVPAQGGDYGVVGGALSRINGDGTVTKLAKLPGEAYGVVATAKGLDTVSAVDGSGVVSHWNGSALSSLGHGPLGDLRLYQQAGGGDLVVGQVGGIRPGSTGLRTLSRSAAPDFVSQHGDLTASVDSEEADAKAQGAIGATAPRDTVGKIYISATATRTGATASGVLTANGPVSTATAQSQVTETTLAQSAVPAADSSSVVSDITGKTVRAPESALSATSLTVTPADFTPGGTNPAASGDYEIAVDLSSSTMETPTCLVPRNSPTDQVLQPSSNMVEWAVDQAVHGDLTITRPANYLATGQASYVPDTMFPTVALDGTSGGVPAQVELGILAQESNFKQASWHAVVGDSGNPLISDYYGTAKPTQTPTNPSGTADDPEIVPDYADTDCGYGIGQVTDGMSSLDATPFSTAQATAVATDYAANIAASVQILGDTWNELYQDGTIANDGDAQYIENWFLTIWGYNSGVYSEADASSNGGNYGVGWLNNPANPNYPADRYPFMDNMTTSNDAANPADWSYEEKVMGWIVHPQLDGNSAEEYSIPNFGSNIFDLTGGYSGPAVNIPEDTEAVGTGIYTFCDGDNSCTPDVSSPCPDDSSACWWHDPVTWITGEDSSDAATEYLSYALGSAEPALTPQYATDCGDETTFRSQFAVGTYVVTSLNDPDQNTRGCTWSGSDGKFTIRLGDNMALADNESSAMQDNPDTAQIDLHQIGAGFLGHFYFTHTYDGTSETSDTTCYGDTCALSATNPVQAGIEHKVNGTWTPNIPATASPEWYEIYASIPDHGANAPSVTYVVDTGINAANGVLLGSPEACSGISQDSDNGVNHWVEIGIFDLGPGADVRLSNMVVGADGTNDIAFGTMVFAPVTATAESCSGQAGTLNGS